VPIPFYGELGSVNPVVVLPGAAAARPAETAAGYAASVTLGAGQFCTNPGLLFVPDDEGLRSAIVDMVWAVTGAPMLSERIHAAFEAAASALAEHASVTRLATGQPGEGPWAATPQVFQTSLEAFAAGLPDLAEERFGPAGLVITYQSVADLLPVLGRLGGNLAGVIHADPASAPDMSAAAQVAEVFARTVGRVVWNGWPTGVAVTWAQHHGGPWPATTDAHYTSVGATAIRRWLVPVTYQDFPAELLPGPRPAAGKAAS
jgi:NADP-dependent aldehyde dehydrogenase